MENFPNIEKDLFAGNKDAFRQAIAGALLSEKKGGYMKGTPGFCRLIFNGVKIPDRKKFSIYRKQIMKAVREIEEGDNELASNPKIRAGAVRAEQRAKKELKMLGREDY